MGSSALEGAASGAFTGSSLGPWGAAAGAGIGLVGGLLADNASKNKAAARAAALEKQAQKRLAQGDQQAASLKGQGQLDQTTQAARLLSSGASTRAEAATDSSLTEIATRANNEAIVALKNAADDAQSIRSDIGAIQQDANANTTASYFNAATTILGTVGNYNKSTLAAKGSGNVTNNYYSTSKG